MTVMSVVAYVCCIWVVVFGKIFTTTPTHRRLTAALLTAAVANFVAIALSGDPVHPWIAIAELAMILISGMYFLHTVRTLTWLRASQRELIELLEDPTQG